MSLGNTIIANLPLNSTILNVILKLQSFLSSRSKILKFLLAVFIVKKWLLPFIGQKILNHAQMKAVRAAIISPRAHQLKMKVWMQMSGTGPLAAVVRLLKPSSVLNHRSEQMATGIVERPLKVPANGGMVDIPVCIVPSVGAAKPDSILQTLHSERFAEFSTNLMLSESDVSCSMNCSNVSISAVGGLVSVSGLKLSTPMSLQGLGGLRDMQITNCRVIGGTLEYMVLQVDCIIYNHSNVSLLDLGDCYFSMSFDPLYEKSLLWAAQRDSSESITYAERGSGFSSAHSIASNHKSAWQIISCTWTPLPEHIGILPGTLATVLLPDLSIEEGANPVSTVCYFALPDRDAEPELCEYAQHILSSFLEGKPTAGLVLTGHYHHATSVDYLLPSMRALSINATLPGISTAETQPMIQSASLKLNMSAITTVITSFAAPSTLVIYNPLHAQVTIRRIKSTIFYQNAVIGMLDVEFTGSSDPDNHRRPMSLPPQHSSSSSNVVSKRGSPSRFRPESALGFGKHILESYTGQLGPKELTPIVIAPHTSVTTAPLPLGLQVNVGALMALYEGSGGSFQVNAETELDVTVGNGTQSDVATLGWHVVDGYTIYDLKYDQANIPVTISLR